MNIGNLYIDAICFSIQVVAQISKTECLRRNTNLSNGLLFVWERSLKWQLSV